MTSTHDDHVPHGHDEHCVECQKKIETMAFKGTGVCGDICLTKWRKAHPLPDELRVTKEEFVIAVSNLHTSQRTAEGIWKVLYGDD